MREIRDKMIKIAKVFIFICFKQDREIEDSH